MNPFDLDLTLKSIEPNFKDHVASHHRFEGDLRFGHAGFEVIEWGKPGTLVYRIRFTIWNGILTVDGDLGQAVFKVYEPASFAFWAGCNLDYFAEKCVASPYGRGFRTWSDTAARRRLTDWFDDQVYPDQKKRQEEFEEWNGWDAIESEAEWFAWLADHGYDVFGDDLSEANLYAAGMDIDRQCVAMWRGLQMAFQVAADEMKGAKP